MFSFLRKYYGDSSELSFSLTRITVAALYSVSVVITALILAVGF